MFTTHAKAFLEIFLRLYKINVIFLQNSMEAGIVKDLFSIGEIIKDAWWVYDTYYIYIKYLPKYNVQKLRVFVLLWDHSSIFK